MKKKTERDARSAILVAVHETARDLGAAGFIDKRRMAEYDALCLPALKPFSRTRIRSLRKRLNVSQAVLAALMNTSVSTIQKWEIGEKQPSGPSLKLLNMIDQKGLEALV